MYNLYQHILFNADKVSRTNVTNLSNLLYFEWLASKLKSKFKDSRSIEELVKLIKDEYKIK